MIVSSVSNYSVGEIVAAGGQNVWFQLYPTPNRKVTRGLLRRAEDAGCRVVVLTVDTPVIGNRELHGTTLTELLKGEATRLGNYEGIRSGETIFDPGMTWDMVRWLKTNCAMQVVLKGIVTGEDAKLCLEHGVDGVIVSNHGGRQLESDRGTVECLPEVVEAIDGRIAVLIDGGIRRGTDIFKALALGADAICIGRPFCWGLAAFGQSGVARALDLLHAELVLDMQLAGVTSLSDITRSCLA
ncbi:MAG: alpha-hydroxy-acid oxidizing protein [Planctomycetes bacterium]|nr:alpha-hydroxy-acid oxidizing protein [Planctomycetota bacterium]